jgi:hypothetical protein
MTQQLAPENVQWLEIRKARLSRASEVRHCSLHSEVDPSVYPTSIFAFARSCFASPERSFSYFAFCNSTFRSR